MDTPTATIETPTRHKFTAETAVQFDGYSMANALILSVICPECAPYEDWFTYARWTAQGFQVQKGQHGTKLMTFIEMKDKEDEKKSHRRPWNTTVFCRHQVAKKEG